MNSSTSLIHLGKKKRNWKSEKSKILKGNKTNDDCGDNDRGASVSDRHGVLSESRYRILYDWRDIA